MKKNHLTEGEQVMNRKSKWNIVFIIVSIFLAVGPWSEVSMSSANASLPDVAQRGFNPDGGYNVFGETPKGFEDVSQLLIFRSLRGRKPLFPSALQIYIRSSHKDIEYRFVASVIIRNKFTFTTASIRGVSYRFEGRFLFDQPYRVDNKPVIEGQLSKYKNGAKVAECKIGFTGCDCVD
jgi:hypothetical protein